MGQGFYTWSTTAGSNGGIDSSINFAEGQAPATLNDSARGVMARLREYANDISGVITTAGTSTAYTVTSNQVFDSLAHLHQQVIGFVPNATSTNAAGADVTLAVDGLTAKPIRMQPSVPLPTGTLVLGTPYVVVYNNTDGAFYLHNMINPFNVPLGCGMDYWGGTSTPNSCFAIANGQQISQTTYASLYALFGANKYGSDGGGLFYLPDKTGRVSAMREASATRLTSSFFGGNSTVLGAVGGAEKQALSSTNQLPQFTPSGNVSIDTNNANVDGSFGAGAGGTAVAPTGLATITASFHGNTIGSASPSSFTTTPPTIICNYIIRIL